MNKQTQDRVDIEIPLGKRTKLYRLFEIIPGALSIIAWLLIIVFSIINPFWASIYILSIVLLMFVRAIASAFRTVQGRTLLWRTEHINWSEQLQDLSDPKNALKKYSKLTPVQIEKQFGLFEHINKLQALSKLKAQDRIMPEQIINVAMVALYNESYNTLGPTLENLAKSNCDVKKQLVVFICYEQRGGQAALDTVAKIKENFSGVFRDLVCVEHPTGLPDEIVGKGPNITYAAHELSRWVRRRHIDPKNVIVTTLDSDNEPHPNYFPYLSYAWITTPNRHQCSFQPICVFSNNIWDAPAPMRVIALSNTFWNVISAMRPNLLKNFASHAQGLYALEQMNYWSKRTIVEDGHQYWRSFFFFNGSYEVKPLYISIGQDAVLSDNLKKTLKAQFIQLRRWGYGASDVAYVATRLADPRYKGKKFDGWIRMLRLLEGHVSLACVAAIILVGAFIPLLINPEAAHSSIIVNDLPLIVSRIQQIATVGLFVTVATSLTILPIRPDRYRKRRRIAMVLQWFLMPITIIFYNSLASFVAQWRLMIGKYMDKFDVTEKSVKQ